MKGNTEMKATHVIPNSFRNLAIAFALIVITGIATAQVSFTELKVKNQASYANSQNDTTKAVRIAAANLISLSLITNDTAAVDVYVQYSKFGVTWSTVMTDSLIYANTAQGLAEFSIRDTDSDLIDNVRGWLRTVMVFRASGNGVSGSHLYTLAYNYRP